MVYAQDHRGHGANASPDDLGNLGAGGWTGLEWFEKKSPGVVLPVQAERTAPDMIAPDSAARTASQRGTAPARGDVLACDIGSMRRRSP